MFDITAGRSAGSPVNAELDPTRAPVEETTISPLKDITAGRAAGTAWNAAQDPTRPASVDDPRR